MILERIHPLPMLLQILTPADNDRGPRYLAQAVMAWHGMLQQREPATLEFGMRDGTAGLYCHCSEEAGAAIRRQLADLYPKGTVVRLDDTTLDAASDQTVFDATLRLVPDVFPLTPAGAFEDRLAGAIADPVAGILSLLQSARGQNETPRVRIVLRPARPGVVRQRRRVVARMQRGFRSERIGKWYARRATSRSLISRLLAWFIGRFCRTSREPVDVTAAEAKLRQPLFDAGITIELAGRRLDHSHAARAIAGIAAGFSVLTPPHAAFKLSTVKQRTRRAAPAGGTLLTADEIALLWHPPTATVGTARVASASFREFEPPATLPATTPGSSSCVLGRVRFRDDRRAVGIEQDARLRHCYCVGRTGTGKSTFLLNMLLGDVQAGRGCCLVDPHGDLAEALLDRIPPRRTNNVVLLDAGDRDFPVAYNPLDTADPARRPLVADAVLTAFKRQFGDSWGPRMEDIFRNALLALLETPGMTLVGLQRLLADTPFRRSLTGRLADPAVRSFWTLTFPSWNDRYRIEAIAAVENKVRQLLSNPILRNIVGQPHSAIDLRAVMDRGDAILVVNLSKGRIGDSACQLLGSFIVSGLQLAAMSRAEIPEADRRDFFVYVDELQNFLAADNPTFGTVLAESRKYRLGFAALSHQYLGQLDDATRAAIFGNVGTVVSFAVGPDDAEPMATQFGCEVTPHDLLNLPQHTALVRLLQNGQPTRPFTMSTLPPPPIRASRADTIRKANRQRYAQPRAAVEHEISRAYGFA